MARRKRSERSVWFCFGLFGIGLGMKEKQLICYIMLYILYNCYFSLGGALIVFFVWGGERGKNNFESKDVFFWFVLSLGGGEACIFA